MISEACRTFKAPIVMESLFVHFCAISSICASDITADNTMAGKENADSKDHYDK